MLNNFSVRAHTDLIAAGQTGIMTWRGIAILGALLIAGASGVRGAELTVAVELRWKGAAVAVPSAPVRNEAGQALRLTRVALLLSGVTLLGRDGRQLRLDGQYGLFDAERGRDAITLRGVPAGTYAGLEFQIGLPPEVNHGDPGRWPAGHALNPVRNGLHWNWQGGYVFAAVEGRWRNAEAARPAGDAGSAATAEAEGGFSYHLATDARRMTVRFLADFEVAEATRVELALDLGRVLGVQRIAADDGSESTHSAEGDALAPRLATALERAWFWLRAERGEAGAGAAFRDTPVTAARGFAGATPRAFVVPEGFPQPELPADNPLTEEGVALGARLFFDARLSGNGTQSCASCHAPTRAFSDAVALSTGADGAKGARNAMPLFNLAWNPSYAWDGSQRRIRDQAQAAWTNPIEMHADPAAVTAMLAEDAALRGAFAAAFGDAAVTPERVTLALEQYLLTLVAADSKFDRVRRGEATLTEEEGRGLALFLTEYDPVRGKRGADCFHCHGGVLFSDYGLRNNGLEGVSVDPGRAAVTGAETDRGKFKTPSLRNVALTAPYMHDGRFASLEEVVAHYDHGVQRATTLDPNLAKHPAAGLGLTAEEQRALVAFLRTLTEAGAAESARGPVALTRRGAEAGANGVDLAGRVGAGSSP